MRLHKKEELRASRIFFDKQPPKFLKIFIVFIAIIFITAFYSSTKVNKPYVVKAQGVVTTTDNKYVSSNVNGSIVTINKESGEKVKAGDVLFTISTGLEGIQKEALLEQIKALETQLEIMDKYKKSLRDQKNLMTKEASELEYYGKVQYYLDTINNEALEKENLKKELKEKIAEKDELESEIKKLQEKLDNFTDEEDESYEEIEVENELEMKKNEIKGIEEEIKQLQQQIDSSSAYSQGTQIYYQLISELGQAQNSTQTHLIELKGNLEMATGQDAVFKVKASNDGIVHYLSPIRVGMPIQQNQVVAEISKDDPGKFIIEAYIYAQDRTKVSIGDPVNIAISGVNTYKYGTLNGTLISIDRGTITQEASGGNLVLYRSLISIDKNQLTTKEKDTVVVLKSMPVEASIVYEKETYFQWLMQLLNFRN